MGVYITVFVIMFMVKLWREAATGDKDLSLVVCLIFAIPNPKSKKPF